MGNLHLNMGNQAMGNLHLLMASPVMDNHHHLFMEILVPLLSISIMTTMMVLPANSVAEIPTTLQEEKLDASLLLGDAAYFISQEFFAAFPAVLMDVKMFSWFVWNAKMWKTQFRPTVADQISIYF